MRFTDLLASEFCSFEGVSVIPVNRTLAALASLGVERVDSAETALELARELGADATIVTAVTEYDPYEPPVVGLTMQWYSPQPRVARWVDPVSASREARAVEPEIHVEVGPRAQVQRVFQGAHESVQEAVKDYATDRDGFESPSGWRRYLRSQELFIRFSCWSTIRSMIKAAEGVEREEIRAGS